MKINKLDKKIQELNVIIEFIESNVSDKLLQKRYILILRHQKALNTDISHNSYSHILNNYSIKSIKKLLGRKIEFNDLSGVSDNITLIMEVFKHKDYYKKYVRIETFLKQIDKITLVVDSM